MKSAIEEFRGCYPFLLTYPSDYVCVFIRSESRNTNIETKTPSTVLPNYAYISFCRVLRDIP